MRASSSDVVFGGCCFSYRLVRLLLHNDAIAVLEEEMAGKHGCCYSAGYIVFAKITLLIHLLFLFV